MSEWKNSGLIFFFLKEVYHIAVVTFVAHCISPPVCQNGGYVNANCQCTCPEGFSGVSCDTVVTDQGNLTLNIIQWRATL